jgi:hypothetical protein
MLLVCIAAPCPLRALMYVPPRTEITIPGITAANANARKRRRNIGILEIDLNISASVPSL